MAQNSIDRQLAKAYTQRQLEKKMNTESRETRDVPSDRSKPIVAYSYNPLYIVVVDRKPNFWLGNEFLGIPKNIESRALSDGIYPTRTEATRYVVQRDVAHFDWGSLTYTFFIYLTAWSPFEQRAQSEFWIYHQIHSCLALQCYLAITAKIWLGRLMKQRLEGQISVLIRIN